MSHTGPFEFDVASHLQSDRLTLKIPLQTPETIIAFFEALQINRPEIHEWFSWVDGIQTIEHARENIGRINQKFIAKKNAQYFIYEKDTGDFCGMVGFMRYYPVHRRGELAYWMDKRKQGKGYMSEALALLEHDLFERGVNRLSLHIDTGNAASEKMARRLGYTREGTLRDYIYSKQHGAFRDFHIFTKLKSDIKR